MPRLPQGFTLDNPKSIKMVKDTDGVPVGLIGVDDEITTFATYALNAQGVILGLRGLNNEIIGGGFKCVVPHDTTSAALQEAHDYAVANGKVLDLAGATYTITTPVNFRTASVNIIGNGAVLDATNMTGSYAIRADSVTGDSMFGAKSRSIDNLTLRGPIGLPSSSGIRGFWVHGTAAGRSPRPTLNDVSIEGFGIGVDLGDYAYLNQFHSCEVYRSGVGIRQSVGTDSGENTAWFGGAIYNCSELCVQTFDESSELFFHSVSFDYTPKIIQQTAGRVCFTDCHVENNGAGWTDDAFFITGDGTDFQMTGGYLVSAGSQPSGIAQLINVADNRARAIFTRVFPHNLGNTTQKIATGPGQVIFRDTQGYANSINANPVRISDQYSLLLDGSFEATTFPRDYWSLTADSGGVPTSRVTGVNGTLALSSATASAGSKSLLANKTATGALTFSLLVPVGRSSGWISGQFKHSAVAGTPLTGAATTWEVLYVCLSGNTANGIPTFESTGPAAATASFTPTVGTWGTVNLRIGVKPPTWATHAVLRFILPSGQTGGLHLDEVSMHQW